MSPVFTSREALTTCALHSIRPSSQALDARALVLKNLAAQSHLSILTRSGVILLYCHSSVELCTYLSELFARSAPAELIEIFKQFDVGAKRCQSSEEHYVLMFPFKRCGQCAGTRDVNSPFTPVGGY